MRVGQALLLAGLVAISTIVGPGSGSTDEMPPPMPRAEARKPIPQVCPEIYEPVCAKKLGHPKSYSNGCFARMDGAADIKPGHCSPGE